MNSDKVPRKKAPNGNGQTISPAERYHISRKKYHMDLNWRINLILKNARNRSSRYNLFFDLDNDYLNRLWQTQNGKCDLTGVEFDLSEGVNNRPNKDGPSLDKIDPSKGYIKGNVRFITYQANWCRSDFGDKALIEFARKLLEHNEGIIT